MAEEVFYAKDLLPIWVTFSLSLLLGDFKKPLSQWLHNTPYLGTSHSPLLWNLAEHIELCEAPSSWDLKGPLCRGFMNHLAWVHHEDTSLGDLQSPLGVVQSPLLGCLMKPLT